MTTTSSRDNWVRLVEAVIKREQIWQLCHQDSITTVDSDFSQRYLSLRSVPSSSSRLPLETDSVVQVRKNGSGTITQKIFSALLWRKKHKDYYYDSDGDHDETGDTNHQRNLCSGTRILLSATELKQKGIHIKALKNGSGVRDIRWKTNCLREHIYLPTLQLDSNTESILRNLKHYESFQYPDPNWRKLSLYLKIMSDMIDTARDAKLLQKKGIIHGNLNDVDELPAMLKRLTPEENIPQTQQVRILSSQIRDYFGL